MLQGLKGTAAGTAAAAAAESGLLGGRLAESKAAAESEGYSFEAPPAPIRQEQIKRAATADVVIVGAGTAGLPAALSAAQADAKVILIEKDNTYSARGGDNTAIGSRLQKQLGIEIDIEEVVRAPLGQWRSGKAERCSERPFDVYRSLLIKKARQ